MVLLLYPLQHKLCKFSLTEWRYIMQQGWIVRNYSASQSINFIPKYQPPEHEEIVSLGGILDKIPKLLVLTGAGISTESGIPDYRSDHVGRYNRWEPIQYGTFLRNRRACTNFWARNYAAWFRYTNFKPNKNHEILNEWEKKGCIHWIVTQNVDMLHEKSGSKRLTELHGSAKNVVCLSCGDVVPRENFQDVLQSYNKHWDHNSVDIRPDGDVFIPQHLTLAFQVPPCVRCKGKMKPDVVFFGENVPKKRANAVYNLVEESDGILVLGSSLQAHSAYRLLTQASKDQKPIAIVNIGQTRADHLASIKINSLSSTVLQRLDALR